MSPPSDSTETEIRELWKRNDWAGKARLQTEKGFFPADIAEAMDASVDTFSMNWGEGLSHDYGTLLFLRQKSSSFGGPSTEDPIIEATEQFMKQFKKQYYKNTTEKIQERMDMEQKLMESELYEDMSIDDEDYYKMDMSDDELDELDEDELKEGADEDLEEDDPDLIEHRDRLMFSEADMLEFDSKGEISPQVSQPSKNEKSIGRKI